jgi:hypothetical protein
LLNLTGGDEGVPPYPGSTDELTGAGLLLPATFAAHLGLKDLIDEHLDLGAKAGRANVPRVRASIFQR